jgi:hypothetical protein
VNLNPCIPCLDGQHCGSDGLTAFRRHSSESGRVVPDFQIRFSARSLSEISWLHRRLANDDELGSPLRHRKTTHAPHCSHKQTRLPSSGLLLPYEPTNFIHPQPTGLSWFCGRHLLPPINVNRWNDGCAYLILIASLALAPGSLEASPDHWSQNPPWRGAEPALARVRKELGPAMSSIFRS